MKVGEGELVQPAHRGSLSAVPAKVIVVLACSTALAASAPAQDPDDPANKILEGHGRDHKRRRVRASLMLTIIATMASSFLQARGQNVGEYTVKAAFLYNFAKFVEWPADSMGGGGSPLVLGVLGDDPFGAAIDQVVAGKTANGRQLVVRRFKWGQDLKQCHILFISSSERKRLAEILGALRGASVLTVGDMDQFGQQGGMIQFVIEQSRVRFEINIGAAQNARLKISSKLLALARNVKG
jgi:hypothetical protein